MSIAPLDRFWERLRGLAQDVVFFQIDLVLTKNSPFRHNLLALASTAMSFQFDENINHAASGEYALSIYRHTLSSDCCDAEHGEDMKSLITNLLHAARYRGLDADLLLTRARCMFDEEVHDEEDEVGDVIRRICCSAPSSGAVHI